MPHFHEDEPTKSYGIREVQTKRYWDMSAIRREVRFYDGAISADHKTAIRSWERYHLARVKKPDLPIVEMVCFEAQPIETGTIEPEIDSRVLMREKVRFHHGAQAEKAVVALMEARSDWKEFRWMIRRNGGLSMVSNAVPEAFSFNRHSFCRTTTEAVQIKLTMGAIIQENVDLTAL